MQNDMRQLLQDSLGVELSLQTHVSLLFFTKQFFGFFFKDTHFDFAVPYQSPAMGFKGKASKQVLCLLLR